MAIVRLPSREAMTILAAAVRHRAFVVGTMSCGPGIALAVVIALAAVIAGHYTRPIPDVVLALLAGIAVNNTLGLPGLVRAGTKFVLHYVLRTAIVLLGTRLTVAGI